MVLNRISEAGGRGAGGFLGGVANNPGVIIIIAILGALVLFRGDIRNAFASIPEAIGNIGNVELPDISLPDITFPTFNFPEFPEITFPEFPDFSNIFQGFQDQLSSLAGQTVDGITIPGDTIINPDGTVSSSTPPTMDLSDAERAAALAQLELNRQRSIDEQALSEIPPGEDISGAEFASAINEEEFRMRQADLIPESEQQTESVFSGIMEKVTSLIPTSQEFFGGGPSFVGGTIFENPIDTFSEVLKFFPGLTASQAADFLEETGGQILPSQVEFIDPDIKNIVASIEGENIQVGFTSPADLESEAIKSACTSCQLFNLNCEQCRGGMA